MNYVNKNSITKNALIFFVETSNEIFNLKRNSQINWLVILRQILFTGYEALPLISFIALGVGGLIILQGYNFLSDFGQTIWVHTIFRLVVVNELSFIIAALIVIARSGTAISTEIGNMVVNREIDLLKSFGISPIGYLVVSRLIGVMLALFALTIYFNVIAVLGGWLFSWFFNRIEFHTFMNDFISVLHFSDILLLFIKPLVFGFIIAFVTSYHGLSVFKASTEVPQRTLIAVVQSIFLIIFFDVIFALSLYYGG
jgi:phospholipid/cholesterol/gamma-HCH transport system permease protein